MRTLTNENYYGRGKYTNGKYDEVPERNRRALLKELSKIITHSIGTGNVWHRLFEDHVAKTKRLKGEKHKTAGESMHWFVETLVPKLNTATSRKSYASSLYTPGSYKYGKTEMMHDKYHTLAPPHLLASLEVILTVSAVPGGVNSLAAFLPTRHCTDQLLCELVIVAKKITASYKKAYDDSKIPRKVPRKKEDLSSANAKLKFIRRASFYPSALYAFSSSLKLGERKVPTLHHEFLRLSAFARAVHHATTGEIPPDTAEQEQTVLTTSGNHELEAMEAIFGRIPDEEKKRIVNAAEAEGREPTEKEQQYWMVGSPNITTDSGAFFFALRTYDQFTKEQWQNPRKAQHFFGIQTVYDQNQDFIRTNQVLLNHRDYSYGNVEHHGMISRENQFDVVFNKMYYGTGSGTLPVIEDVDWMRENVSAETKGKRGKFHHERKSRDD